MENDEEIVSFDVVSLFTSIPTELAIEIAKGRLNNDSTLNSRTGLSPDDICDMLAFCLNSTQFQFRGKYYKQSQGTAMGSPVSVVVANMVMEHIEQKAISPLHVEPKIYFRFVDDTIDAIKKRLIDQFHNHLNAQHSNIQFTVERYNSETGLAFLDSRNVVSDDGSITVDVYRKKTHTDRYLNIKSHHPIQHKAAVVDTLCTRAIRIPSTQQGRNEEIKHICTALGANGYPKQL